MSILHYNSRLGPYHGNVAWEVATGSAAEPAFLAGAAALSDGRNYLAFPSGNVFGYYNTTFSFLLHLDLGWKYAQDGQADVYLYDFQSGAWWYIGLGFGFPPCLYDFTHRAVLYYPDPKRPAVICALHGGF